MALALVSHGVRVNAIEAGLGMTDGVVSTPLCSTPSKVPAWDR